MTGIMLHLYELSLKMQTYYKNWSPVHKNLVLPESLTYSSYVFLDQFNRTVVK